MREDLSNVHDPQRFYGIIAARVDVFISDAEGIFYLRDVYDYSDAHDDRTKAAVRQAIHKAKKDEKIESSGGRAGCYRRIEGDFEVVDLTTLGNEPPMDIKLPLGLDGYVELYPKDLVVYSGTPNSGKSAFMLETVRLNMNQYQCFYFSTEMSGRNCSMRISKHTETPLSDWKIKFSDDFTNYKDIIQPDDLNFIDYVEAADGEFFKIPSILSGIQRKLQGGLAFVALQKNPGNDNAIGGVQTKAKPSVFSTIENSIFKIVKAKNWSRTNPNGFTAKFKIYNGINISRVGKWEAP